MTRPSHADQLHFDLWWRGLNIACDAGTYLYNAEAPWDNSLTKTAVHNTVSVDLQDQMTRAGRFLWIDWAHGKVNTFVSSPGDRLVYWEGAHDGYLRSNPPVQHRRSILLINQDEGTWLVGDRLISQGSHRYRLHWLFPDLPYTWDEDTSHLVLHTDEGDYHIQIAVGARSATFSLVRADPGTPAGWRSLYYGVREPALALTVDVEATSCTYWTLFGREAGIFSAHDDQVSIQTSGWAAAVTPADPDGRTLISEVQITGDHSDTFSVVG